MDLITQLSVELGVPCSSLGSQGIGQQRIGIKAIPPLSASVLFLLPAPFLSNLFLNFDQAALLFGCSNIVQTLRTAGLQPFLDQGPDHEADGGTTVAAGIPEVVNKLLVLCTACTEGGVDGLALGEIAV